MLGFGKKERKEPEGLWAQVNDKSSYRGAVRSMISGPKDGVRMIREASNTLKSQTRQVFEKGKVERFEDAMERLNVGQEDLPLIHNQILIQVYFSFFVGTLAWLVALRFLLTGSYFAGLVGLMVGLASMANYVQGAIRAKQIRTQTLGGGVFFLDGFRDWLPSRLSNVAKMEKNDPLRRPEIVAGLEKSARRFMLSSAVLFSIGMLVFGMKWEIVPSVFWVSFLICGVGFLMLGSWFSFQAFKRRKGLRCDMFFWFCSPKYWVPLK